MIDRARGFPGETGTHGAVASNFSSNRMAYAPMTGPCGRTMGRGFRVAVPAFLDAIE
jgi:hypothetical protein